MSSIISSVDPPKIDRGLDVPSIEKLLEGPSERELYSGKVPLRPIQRAALLVGGSAFIFFLVVLTVAVVLAGRGQSTFIKGLLFVLILGWYLLLFIFACRLIWSALTARSQKTKDDEMSRIGD